MGKKYYVVFIGWDGDVSYGVASATYLAKICESEEEAKAYIDSPACKAQVEEIGEKHGAWFGGSAVGFYKEFSNHDEPLYIDGAYYAE